MKKSSKEEVLNLIQNRKYKKLIPFLMSDFREVFSVQEMKLLIIDEESEFFKAIITIFSKHLDENYDYDEEIFIEDLSFLSICNNLEKHRIQSLCLSVMTDPSITNYFQLIEQGLLLKFSLDELIEILESFDINRFEAFLQSVSEATQHLMEFDEYQEGRTFLLLVQLGENLSKSLKTNIVEVISRSKPQTTYLEDKFLRKDWDLPLNLGILGWFKDLNSEQLQNLITHLKSNYRDKTIDSWVRMQFRLSIKKLKTQLKEWHQFPFEKLSLTKAQIRGFLYRLAGEEGCQYSGLKWRCGGKGYTYAKKVLNLMDIQLVEQQILFELCKKYGGNCDCEILMNAAPRLLKEETPW